MSYDMLNYVISDLFLRKNDGDYVAGIKYKYSWEKDFHFSNEIVSYNYSLNQVEWLNDWYEGQGECELVYLYNIDFLVNFYRKAGGNQ